MNGITKTQFVTIILIVAYVFYEFVLVRKWMSSLPPSDPIIRADLIFIYHLKVPPLFVAVLFVLL